MRAHGRAHHRASSGATWLDNVRPAARDDAQRSRNPATSHARSCASMSTTCAKRRGGVQQRAQGVAQSCGVVARPITRPARASSRNPTLHRRLPALLQSARSHETRPALRVKRARRAPVVRSRWGAAARGGGRRSWSKF
ncbi:hypothetical protein F511_47439 [Dorcoceras hygrometricum]|uniref:Uncharacterized protein n=1 Tax=Dorcoceras hygrometricum TaxID=472368 RepID=A0A2Z6ZR31_9LAMI|nr:hypothetical protein F511_47439 [Dorcoceras hygrometricum]